MVKFLTPRAPTQSGWIIIGMCCGSYMQHDCMLPLDGNLDQTGFVTTCMTVCKIWHGSVAYEIFSADVSGGVRLHLKLSAPAPYEK